jgi:hypothetical protein
VQLTRGGNRVRSTDGLVAAALVAGALLLAPASVLATLLEIDGQDARYRFEYFSDSDNVQVFSNIGEYEFSLSGESRLSIGWNREVVVVPGISAPAGSQEAVDSISGASRPVSSTQDPFSDFRKTRNQLDTRVTWRGISGRYYRSNETDYFAQQLAGGVERAFFGDHLLLGIGLSYGWDDIQPLEDDDTNSVSDHKNTLHGSFVATQVVTPTTLVQIGAEWNEVNGLQHNPYRNVYVDGAYAPEVHPDARTRRDVFFKVNQYLSNRSSAKVSYKYYTDDWGIDSHTLQAKLNQYVSDSVIVRYRYRFYDQSAADFFRDDYLIPGGVNGYRTGDYRMGEFTAHLFGTRMSWNIGRGPIVIPALDGIRMNFKYERYFNSNNFSANIFESGLAFSF